MSKKGSTSTSVEEARKRLISGEPLKSGIKNHDVMGQKFRVQTVDDITKAMEAQVTRVPNTSVGNMMVLGERNAEALAKAQPLYDRVNNVWAKAEEHIQKLGVLAPVEFCYDSHNEMSWYIGVQKRNGKWRISHGEYSQYDAERYRDEGYCVQWTAMSDCSIDLRIAMAKHIGQLIGEVVKTNEKTVPELEKSVVEMESTLKNLGIL